jgi:Flp pilus assembly protein TadG
VPQLTPDILEGVQFPFSGAAHNPGSVESIRVDADNAYMTAGVARNPRRAQKQRGQSLVEFGISSIVLLLLTMGLLDFGRAFYFAVALEGAAREGARHGAWFDTASRSNIYLDDADIMTAVNQALLGAGLTAVQGNQGGPCLAGGDGNGINNKPYGQTVPGTQKPVVFICYTPPSGGQLTTITNHPTDNSWRLGDVNVSIIMNFQIITPFIQALFGNGIPLQYNEHFTIQGKP